MSGFLLDTNIVSELIKPRPNAQVAQWLEQTDESVLYLSVLTLGEIRKGVSALPNFARRAKLEAWLDGDLKFRFSDRILPIGQEIADRWGRLSGQALAKGKPLPVIDGLLAATALEHNLTMVTRDTRQLGAIIAFFDPWAPQR